MQSFNRKTVVVYGLGKSGIATAYALRADEARVILVDQKPYEEVAKDPAVLNLVEKEGCIFIQTETALFDGRDFFDGVSALFKTPGMKWSAPLLKVAQDVGLPILGDVDYFYDKNKASKFIGITGTNGKSTTTALVGHVLKEAGYSVAVGGNIGQAVMGLPSQRDYYVIEMSSYQLELMEETIFDRAVILNLTPDHLDRHGTMEEYLQVKLRIFNRQSEDAVQVMGVDDEMMKNAATQVDAKNLSTVSAWSTAGDVHIDADGHLMAADREILNMRDLANIPGRHNWQNVAAVYALLNDIVTDDAFIQALKTFRALPHRMEQVFHTSGLICVNDSKATNPDAVVHALNSFTNVYWILGGMAKDEGVTPCLAHTAHVQAAFTIGASGDEFAEKLEASGVRVFRAKTLDVAVRMAHDRIRLDGLPYARLLLSPACASWDQFNSFEHRGDVFASLCKDIFQDFK